MNKKLIYYEEEANRLIPLQEDTIPDEVLMTIDQAFEKYKWEYGEYPSGVVIRDPLNPLVNIVAEVV